MLATSLSAPRIARAPSFPPIARKFAGERPEPKIAVIDMLCRCAAPMVKGLLVVSGRSVVRSHNEAAPGAAICCAPAAEYGAALTSSAAQAMRG